jgi:UDP-N-acetylmuramoylalanine-D-glutamate ligase
MTEAEPRKADLKRWRRDCGSFDQFVDFEARGECFRELVLE